MTEQAVPAPASQASGSLPSVDVVDLGWLEGRAEAWDCLAADAITPNPFYARRIITAHVAHGLAGSDLRFIVVHRRDRLLALLPFRPGAARLGLRRIHGAFVSPYIVTSTPLVSRDPVAAAVNGLLDGLGAAGPLWLFPLLALENSAGEALRAGLAARSWPSQTISPFDRAVLDGADEAAYERHMGASRRKDLRRRRKRFAELGHLEHAGFVDGDGLRRAVEEFLALERSGWKGAAGTALASRPETAAFLRAAFADTGGPVTCRADVLTLDRRPIAISLAYVCGGTAYLFKTAYDERLRRYAPGVLLEDEIVRARRRTGFAERLNSASLAGSVLETLYPHREATGDLLFATDHGVSAEALATLGRREAIRRRTAERLKGLYRRLRAACHPTSAKGLESVEAK
jgi:CelD/BcsL family acetyltransferase involved in cellulose biosynthesis